MITASIKTTRKRIIGTLCVILAFIIASIMFFAETQPDEKPKAFTEKDFIEFVESFGWETEEGSVTAETLILPEKPDEIMQKYCALQKEAGYELEPFLGKEAEKYTCKVTNFEGTEEIYASAYVCGGKIAAADLSSYGEGWQTSIDGKADRCYYLDNK